MKITTYSAIILFVALFVSCSKDSVLQVADPEIAFVYEDGREIADGECANSASRFALKVTLSGQNNNPTIISYTLNNIVYRVTFTNTTVVRIPLTLIEGENTAQLIGSDVVRKITLVSQEGFQLID